MKEKIIEFFKSKDKIILILFALTLVLSIFALFVNDFNFLKVLIFVNFILIIIALILFIQLFRKPKEEKPSLFFIIQNLLDYLQEGVVIYDDDFKIVFVNDSFAKLVNLKRENLVDLVVKSEMVRSETYCILANIFFPFLQGEDLKIVNEKPETIEVQFRQPEKKYFLIVYTDIYLEKRYKLRIVLDRTKDVIESQRRLEFVQMIGHNLLTPLSEVRWNLEAINWQEISAENKEFINNALQIVKSTIFFAESLLNFVRTEIDQLTIKIEEVDLEKIVITILDVLKGKIEEKKLKVNVEIEEKVAKVNLDKSIVSLSLFALIENAVLYNKLGGSVEIKIQKMAQRPYLEIIIQDTGVGMSKEDLLNLFKKYYRGKKAKELDIKGFGIGLYNAKNLINFHGGDVKVQSEENKGTKVIVTLPLDPNLIPGYLKQ